MVCNYCQSIIVVRQPGVTEDVSVFFLSVQFAALGSRSANDPLLRDADLLLTHSVIRGQNMQLCTSANLIPLDQEFRDLEVELGHSCYAAHFHVPSKWVLIYWIKY